MNRVSTSFMVLPIVAFAGCVPTAPEGQLRTRAAFDLKCSEGDLSVADLGGGVGDSQHGATRGVTGCGQRATYIYDGYRRAWLMNNMDTPAAPMQQTQSAPAAH